MPFFLLESEENMRWWYNNEHGNWNDIEDVLFAITSDALSHLDNHTIGDYFIYNNNGLYKIIKGCELDPLTIYSHNWTERQKNGASHIILAEFGEDFEEKWKHMSLLVSGEYERNKADYKDIKAKETIIDNIEVRRQNRFKGSDSKKRLSEYELKMDFNIPTLNEKRIHLYSSELNNFEEIKDTIKEIFELYGNQESCYYVIGLNSNYDLLGIIKLYRLDNQLYKFLLLLGCNKYIVIHNDYYGNDFITEEDKAIYDRLWNSFHLLDIQLSKFYRITKNRDIDIMQ